MPAAVGKWISGRVFRFVHGNNLVYNTCWEDPRLDREAMQLTPTDRVMVITSAGCNALDYVLQSPAQVHAVDMNPRQNALLELKLAGIRRLEFEDFYELFGNGRRRGARQLYATTLREALSPWGQRYWDRRIGFFDHPRKTFYFRGTSGSFARFINWYIDRVAHVRPLIEELFQAPTPEAQQRLYQERLKPRFWTRSMRFFLGRDTTMSLVGVPRAQREQVERDYEGGIVQFIEDCLDAVFGELPLHDNYFWRVYITGRYLPECCPEYLKPENFHLLKQGLVDRVSVHTNSVEGFLKKHPGEISRFVLLDHMDWLSSHHFPRLESEWQAILRRAAAGARILWRSGGLRTDFVDRVRVKLHGEERQLGEMLHYNDALSSQLHARDRVHTYGSFYIADLAA